MDGNGEHQIPTEMRSFAGGGFTTPPGWPWVLGGFWFHCAGPQKTHSQYAGRRSLSYTEKIGDDRGKSRKNTLKKCFG
jgi:hypothetical protein